MSETPIILSNRINRVQNKVIMHNPVRRHTIGMLIIGGIVWAVYILFLNAVYWGGFSYEFASVIGIPFSWVLNYFLNANLNFEQKIRPKAFISFAVVSGIGWLTYLIFLYIFASVFGFWFFYASILAIVPSTFFNIIFQMAVTFGWMGEISHPDRHEPVPADYDWNAFHDGNVLQKWWKRKIAGIILDMVREKSFGYEPDGFHPGVAIDLGCGSSPILQALGFRMQWGIEVDDKKVAFMNSIESEFPVRNTRYIQGRAEATNFIDETAALTLCIEVLEHHLEPEKLIEEISRITEDDGMVIIATPDFATPMWNIIEVLYGLLMRKGYHGEHVTKFTESSVIAMCRVYGLVHVETQSIFGADKIMRFNRNARR